jgi:O-antigen ligase
VLCAALYGSVFFGSSLAVIGSIALGVPSRYLTVGHRALVLGLACLSILSFAYRPASTYRGWARPAILLFWLLYCYRVFVERRTPDLPMPPSEYLIFAIGVCLVPLLGFTKRFSERAMGHAFWAVVVTGCAGGLMSFWLFGSTLGTSFGRLRRGEQIGDFVATNPLQFSYLGSALMLLALYLFFDPAHTRTRLRRTALIGMLLAAGAVPFLLGASRGAAATVVLVSMAIILLRHERPGAAFGAFFTLGLLAISLLLYSETLGSGLISRLADTSTDIQSGAPGELRLQIYQEAFRKFRQGPLLGNGLFVERFSSHPHNLLLEGFMTTGIAGGAALTLFMAVCLWRAIIMLHRGSHDGWVAVLFLHYLIGAQVSSSVVLNGLLWASAGGVLGSSLGGKTLDEEAREETGEAADHHGPQPDAAPRELEA